MRPLSAPKYISVPIEMEHLNLYKSNISINYLDRKENFGFGNSNTALNIFVHAVIRDLLTEID